MLVGMQYVCDAPGGLTWFSMETQAEADAETELMSHAVAKYFLRFHEAARRSYRPREGLASIERDIGLKDHIRRESPVFLTLRDGEGRALVTAMLSREVRDGRAGDAIIVGERNSDPYPQFHAAIAALGSHYGVDLPREACFPYARDIGRT